MPATDTFPDTGLVQPSSGEDATHDTEPAATGLGGAGGIGGPPESRDGNGSNDGDGPIGAGGTIGTGGGASAGGSMATGGVIGGGGSTSAGAMGGARGTISAGGTVSPTGGSGTGGIVGGGGSTSAGTMGGTGGSISAGGTASSGGGIGTGGITGSGGSASSGGSVGTGGVYPTGGTVSTGGGVATGGNTGTAGAAGCVSAGGPVMVKMPAGYCIDSTEVTRGEYSAWLGGSSAPALPASSDPNCGWKSTGSYAPDAACMDDPSRVCQGADCANHPQPCVDWCDAYAYCKGVGKRLCGRIGGGPNPYGDYAKASASQWYDACSSGGRNTYPYGSTYLGTVCNGSDYWAPGDDYGTVPVGSLPGCRSEVPGYTGTFDMSGNVFEWEDSCEGDGRDANCRIRGGGFTENGDLACDYDYVWIFARYDVSSTVGFRCCSD